MAVGNVDKFMCVGKGEVSVLEDEFPCSCLILHDMHMVNTGGEFGGDMIMVFMEFGLAVGIGPENHHAVSVEGSNPVALGMDSAHLACCSLADGEFFSFPKLNQVIILGLDRLEVLDDHPEINMLVTEVVAPGGVWERGAIPLGIKTTDGILGVKVVDSLEHLGLLLSAEVCLASPGGFSTSCTPVPSIVWVVDIIIVVDPL